MDTMGAMPTSSPELLFDTGLGELCATVRRIVSRLRSSEEAAGGAARGQVEDCRSPLRSGRREGPLFSWSSSSTVSGPMRLNA